SRRGADVEGAQMAQAPLGFLRPPVIDQGSEVGGGTRRGAAPGLPRVARFTPCRRVRSGRTLWRKCDSGGHPGQRAEGTGTVRSCDFFVAENAEKNRRGRGEDAATVRRSSQRPSLRPLRFISRTRELI